MQLEGTIQFGLSPSTLVDFSDEVSSLTVEQTLTTASRPKTFANAQDQTSKSGYAQAVTVNFFNDERLPAGLVRTIWAAQLDDSTADDRQPGELYFSANFYADVAPDPDTNPTYTGWVLVTGVNVGGTVGEFKQQNQTWPAREVSEATGS